jgi:N,N'-diacetyllegionaminate synthase
MTQIPITSRKLRKGTIVNQDAEIIIKESSGQGLPMAEINRLIGEYYVLSKEKSEGDVFRRGDFKKATIAAIIACRLKSTRLKRKALLKIGNLASIELCLKNALKLENTNYTILATSTLEEDAELEHHTYSENVIFHKGDPEDVIDRYLGIIDQYKIDVVIRQTGDNAFTSNEIAQFLLKSHFRTGADMTLAKKAALGTDVNIFNTATLKRIRELFPVTEYSEYMPYYVLNNPAYFKINWVDLPENLIRNYRLTLDYPADLEMFNHLVNYFEENNTDYSTSDLFDYLDHHPSIAKINSDMVVKYAIDQDLINLLKEKTTFRE